MIVASICSGVAKDTWDYKSYTKLRSIPFYFFLAEFDLDNDNGLNWMMDVFQYLGPTYPAAVMYYVRQRALFSLAAFDALVTWQALVGRELVISGRKVF